MAESQKENEEQLEESVDSVALHQVMLDAEAKYRREEDRVHQDAEYLRAKIAFRIATAEWLHALKETNIDY